MQNVAGERTRATRSPGWAALCLVLACCAGCVGPTALQKSRLRYNEAFRRTNDEQLLLNIVCLRYADSPVFVDLPNITSQFEVSGTGGFTGGYDGSGPGRTNLGMGSMLISDAPTLSYHPREGREMARALMNPMVPDTIRVARAGMNLQQTMLLLINDINDHDNAVPANDMVPLLMADNHEFRHLADLFGELADRGLVELVTKTTEEERSDPIDGDVVFGRDLAIAAKDDFVFRTTADPQKLQLKKRSHELVMRVKPAGRESPEMLELAEILGIPPGQDEYTIRSEFEEEEDGKMLRTPLGDEDIVINTRSVLQMLTFLSKGVCVPPEHVARGVAPTLRGPDGCPYDWTTVTDGLFRIYHSKKKPRDAEVAVPYKGYWFYIREDDAPSKSILTVVDLLFSLQMTEDVRTGPLLTLPVNN